MTALDHLHHPIRLTPRLIHTATGVSIETARRYLRQNDAPAPVVRLLEIHHLGNLPSPCPTWAGWQIRGPWLVDPDGLCYEADEIRARWLVWQMLSARADPGPRQLRLF